MNSENQKSFVPVYPFSRKYAEETGELAAHQTSLRENRNCAQVIDQTISNDFDGMRLKPDSVRKVLEQFGPERVSWVLANTVTLKDYDGRFSAANKSWAQIFDIHPDRDSYGYDRNCEYECRSHPTILDGFIARARREIAAMQTPKAALYQGGQVVSRSADRKSVMAAIRSHQAEKSSETKQAPKKHVQKVER